MMSLHFRAPCYLAQFCISAQEELNLAHFLRRESGFELSPLTNVSALDWLLHSPQSAYTLPSRATFCDPLDTSKRLSVCYRPDLTPTPQIEYWLCLPSYALNENSY